MGSSIDLFCRVMAQSDLCHDDFCNLLADLLGGVRSSNWITTDCMHIAVDENDFYQRPSGRNAADEWLHFRYSIGIDPVATSDQSSYIDGISNALRKLWALRIQAVAACGFEDLLPYNQSRP
jgi:hypothetical protein